MPSARLAPPALRALLVAESKPRLASGVGPKLARCGTAGEWDLRSLGTARVPHPKVVGTWFLLGHGASMDLGWFVHGVVELVGSPGSK